MTELVASSNIEVEGLPESWVETTVGELAQLVRGVSYKKNESSAEPQQGLLPILRANNLGETKLNFDSLVYVPSQRINSEQLIKRGDVVIAMSSGSKNLVGKASQAQSDYEGGFGAFCSVVRPVSRLDGSLVGFFFQSDLYRKAISKLSSGVNINNLRRQHIEDMPFPLPPLNEQHRIVEKIEELFTRLDAGVEALEHAQAQLKKYRQSVLNAAVTGELSREWRAGELESASELLERILEERRQKWTGKKYKEPVEPERDELSELPTGWAQATLDQVLREPMGNGLSVRGSDSPPGVASLKLNALRVDGFDFNQVRYLSVENSRVANLWIREGDFFIVRGNGTLSLVGVGCMAQAPPVPAIFPDTMIRARITEALRFTGWLSTVWQSNVVRQQIEAKAKTSAGIWKVSQSDLKSVVFPCPSLEEQRFIVSEVECRFSIIDQLEATIEDSLKRSESLRQSILKRAFSGRLVEQDPDDEPASALLKRIREERLTTNQKGKKPKSGKNAAPEPPLFAESEG